MALQSSADRPGAIGSAGEDARSRCLACGEMLPSTPAFGTVDRLHGAKGRFSVAICQDCGSGTTLPHVNAGMLEAFYPSSYGPYLDQQFSPLLGLVSRAIRRWRSWRSLRGFPIGRLVAGGPGVGIDVGCGTGDLAAGLIGRGWRMLGVEPSVAAAESARSRGVDIRIGTLADVELEEHSLDAAVFQQSLEHTVDPLADLIRIRAALRPSGMVAISVPNFGCWQARRLRSRWFHLDCPRHRTHFTAEGLTRLLARAGYDTAEIRTSTSDVGLPASLQYAIAGRCLFRTGLRLRVASGLAALSWPVAAGLNRAGGGGDILHAIALSRP